MRVLFYDDDKKEINRYELDPAEGTYGVNIPRGQWHTIEVLCAGTVIFEVKDGPYIPIAPNDMLEQTSFVQYYNAPKFIHSLIIRFF